MVRVIDAGLVGILAGGMVLSAPCGTAADAPPLRTSEQRTAYALGADLGRSLRNRGIALDPEIFGRGLRDGLQGSTTVLTKEEIHAAILGLQNGERDKETAKRKQDGEAFLAANGSKEGVVALPSGLQYKVLKAGTGPRPTADDVVLCHYRSTFVDGREFADSYKQDKPARIAVAMAVDGWAEALQLMGTGSKWQLFVPPHLLRPKVDTRPGSVPDAPLLFEVELLSIEEKK